MQHTTDNNKADVEHKLLRVFLLIFCFFSLHLLNFSMVKQLLHAYDFTETQEAEKASFTHQRKLGMKILISKMKWESKVCLNVM